VGHFELLKNETLTFSLKVCNQLPSNLDSYNRKKGMLLNRWENLKVSVTA